MSEQLLAMMAAKGINYEAVGGGRAEITSTDVAAALSGLPKLDYYLGLLKVADDQTVRPELTLEVNRMVALLYFERGWRAPFDDNQAMAVFFEQMGVIAVDEVLGNLHKACGGTGVLKGKPCPGCAGTGIKNLSGRAIASRLGINESVWRRTWSERYGEIVRQLYGCYWNSIYHLGDHLGVKEAA